MTNPETVINERVKELDKKIRQANRQWHKYSDKSHKLKETAPTYSNEFDYSHEYGHETLEILKGYESKEMGAITVQIACKDEKKYLRSILRRSKDKKFKIYPFNRYGGLI